jgi:hypothetical protein
LGLKLYERLFAFLFIEANEATNFNKWEHTPPLKIGDCAYRKPEVLRDLLARHPDIFIIKIGLFHFRRANNNPFISSDFRSSKPKPGINS